MGQWQYRIETTNYEDLEGFQERLDALGADGWEAVSMTDNENQFTALLKKPGSAQAERLRKLDDLVVKKGL